MAASRARRTVLLAGLLLATAVVTAAMRDHGTRQGTQAVGMVLDTLAVGLGQPMSLVVVAPDSALIASHDGTIRHLELSTGRVRRVAGAPVPLNDGEAGTYDLALHPDFSRTRQVFISHVIGTRSSNALAVMRGRLVGDSLRDTTTILVTATRDSGVAHYGGQMTFRDGYLFLSNGDRHHRARVQDLGAHNGKVLRIDTNGLAPRDNPFNGRPGALPEIWSFGHRNVQGLAFDSARAILWAHEHGPRNGDEVNRIERGRDYGWPRISLGWEYDGGPIGAGLPVDSATPHPQWVWTPTVAPSGLHVYSGRAFPAWRGNLLSGTMHAVRGRHLNRLAWDGERFVLEERLFTGQVGRIRFVAEDHRGWIYLGNDDGQVLRLRPASGR
jgi:glucose/arabinose dehydrogenase